MTTYGIVGENTIKALNVPDEVIIDQIRINLERVRWVMSEDIYDRDQAVLKGLNAEFQPNKK